MRLLARVLSKTTPGRFYRLYDKTIHSVENENGAIVDAAILQLLRASIMAGRADVPP